MEKAPGLENKNIQNTPTQTLEMEYVPDTTVCIERVGENGSEKTVPRKWFRQSGCNQIGSDRTPIDSLFEHQKQHAKCGDEMGRFFGVLQTRFENG